MAIGIGRTAAIARRVELALADEGIALTEDGFSVMTEELDRALSDAFADGAREANANHDAAANIADDDDWVERGLDARLSAETAAASDESEVNFSLTEREAQVGAMMLDKALAPEMWGHWTPSEDERGIAGDVANKLSDYAA